MSAHKPQVIDNEEFIGILDYDFGGNDYTVSRKRSFITAYHEHGSIYHAALATPVSRKTVYLWMERDTAFAQAVKDSHEDCADDIETSVFKRAKTDSLLAMFYLKAKRPQFRDKLAIDIPTIQNQVKEFMTQLLGSNNARAIPIDTSSQQKEPLLIAAATVDGPPTTNSDNQSS